MNEKTPSSQHHHFCINSEISNEEAAHRMYVQRKAWARWAAGEGSSTNIWEGGDAPIQRALPSRQLSNLTVKQNRDNIELLEALVNAKDDDECVQNNQVDIIVRDIQMDEELMKDNLEAEMRRRETLRNLPQNLTIKRKVRSKLSASISLQPHQKPLSFLKSAKYSLSFKCKRLYENLQNSELLGKLWHKKISKIEGRYGSSVASYFYFVRRLFVINFCLSMSVLGFIMIPQIIYDINDGTPPSGDSSNSTTLQMIGHFFSGSGIFKDTIMFYGHYYHGVINETGNLMYKMPYAYFFTMTTLYGLSFILISYKIAQAYRRNFIESTSDSYNSFSTKVFCGWDFSISSQKTAQLHSNIIFNEFKELLNKKFKTVSKQSKLQRLVHFFYLTIINVFVLAMVAAAEYLIWRLLTSRSNQPADVWALNVATVVTLVLILYPYLFSHIVKLERYSQRVKLYVTLVRIFAVDISILILLLLFWYQKDEDCWETSLGQEIYCLMILDLAASLFLLPFIELIRRLLFRYCTFLGEPEFNIATGTMSLVHTQAFVWLGLWFSPVVCFGALIKMFVSFYLRSVIVRRSHGAKVWRASHSQTLMLAFVFLSQLLAVVFYSFLMFRRSSTSCGTFKEYDFIYLVLTKDLLKLYEEGPLSQFINFLFRPVFVAAILIAMCAFVYYTRAVGVAQRSKVALLRHMLTLESKDKHILLDTIAKVTSGEWVYKRRSTNTICQDSSYTWKYLNDENFRRPLNSSYRLSQKPKEHRNESISPTIDILRNETPLSVNRNSQRNLSKRNVLK